MPLSERLGALAEPRFRLLWIGRAASVIGDAVMPVTLVFAILSLGGSASDIGLVLGTSMAVRVALLVLGGTVADRVPRRVVLIGSDLALAAVQLAIGVLLFTGGGSVAMLLGAAVFYGAASAMSKPAMTGIVPQTVSRERLQQANALMGISQSTAQIVGPAIAGLIVALSTPAWAYLLDATTYVASASTLLLLRIPPSPRKAHGHFLRDIVAGWQEMVSRPWYWAALCSHAVWNLGSCVFVVLGPVIVNDKAGGPASWGLVAASTAAGSLIGGLVVLRWRPRRPLVTGHLALLLTAPQIASLIGPSPVVLIMASAMLGSAGVTVINQLWATATQQLIPEQIISRISSYDWLVSFTVAPFGYVLAGPLSQRSGISTTLVIALFLVTVPVLALLTVPGIRMVRQTRAGGMSFAQRGQKAGGVALKATPARGDLPDRPGGALVPAAVDDIDGRSAGNAVAREGGAVS